MSRQVDQCYVEYGIWTLQMRRCEELPPYGLRGVLDRAPCSWGTAPLTRCISALILVEKGRSRPALRQARRTVDSMRKTNRRMTAARSTYTEGTPADAGTAGVLIQHIVAVAAPVSLLISVGDFPNLDLKAWHALRISGLFLR